MYSIVFSRAVRNLNRNIRRQKVAYIQLIRYKRQGPLRYFVNSTLKEVVLVFFLIASRIDQMVRRLLTRSSKTGKMFCWSWRKTSMAASGTLWFSPTQNYADIDFGVLVNNYSGYTKPKNVFMQKYVFLGILPKSIANKNTTQGFKSNGIMLEFWNCDANPNSFFALFPNHHHQLPYGHGKTSVYENSGIAVNWRSHAKAVTSGSLKMPNKFFFLTELHFGGCGCYTSSDRWKKFGYNATAIGIR